MKSFKELSILCDAETERIRVRALSGEAVAGRQKKGVQAAAANLAGAEVLGQESFSVAGRKSAADAVDLAFIQWGGSQKVQLAGAGHLDCVSACSESLASQSQAS